MFAPVFTPAIQGPGSPPPAPLSRLQEVLRETLGDEAPNFIVEGTFSECPDRRVVYGRTKGEMGMQGRPVVLKAIINAADFEREKAMLNELKGLNVAMDLLAALQSEQTNTAFNVLVLPKANCAVDK